MKYMKMPGRLKKRMRLAAGFLVIFLFTQSSRAAAPAPKNLVKAELLADVAAIQPGKPFNVGVLFTIKPTWHIYWKNPGDSGLPTRVKFHLPQGFQVGELLYPKPQRIQLPGDIINYGYENQTMLMATITPPANVSGDVEIAADVSWLVCQDICLPGKTSLKLTLGVSNSPSPANQKVFEEYEQKIPAPAEKLSGVGVDPTHPLDLSTGEGETDIIATLRLTDTAIPDKIPGLEITVAQPVPDTYGTRYHIKAKVLPGQHVTAKKLQVLIAVYNVTVPIVGVAEPATTPSPK